VQTWDGAVVRSIMQEQQQQRRTDELCATECEVYGEAYMASVLTRHPGFKLIGGKLRFRDMRETPHVVDFFYKRFAALQLLRRIERQRGWRYTSVVVVRPDVCFVSRDTDAARLPAQLLPRTVYVHDSDHHHDSTDTDSTADPMARGLCGQMPQDWFAFGDRESMGLYLGAFPALPAMYAQMRKVSGACDWWKCHNYRYNFTFLLNAESFLGYHLRASGLGCKDVRHLQPPIALVLPPTRIRHTWRASSANWTAQHPTSLPYV
jgi:hypothetical protein